MAGSRIDRAQHHQFRPLPALDKPNHPQHHHHHHKPKPIEVTDCFKPHKPRKPGMPSISGVEGGAPDPRARAIQEMMTRLAQEPIPSGPDLTPTEKTLLSKIDDPSSRAQIENELLARHTP